MVEMKERRSQADLKAHEEHRQPRERRAPEKGGGNELEVERREGGDGKEEARAG